MNRVEACIVNHNTSPFAELCLRSLVAAHDPGDDLELRVTVADNHSTDGDVDALRAAAVDVGATFERTRWPVADAALNTHGDVLRDFVLARPDAEGFLFLDADIAFTSPGTVGTMASELEADHSLWAVQARFAGSEVQRGDGASLDIGAGSDRAPIPAVGDPITGDIVARDVPDRGKPRCHPGCSLIRATDTFRRTALTVGLGCAVVVSGDPAVGGFHDTLGLATTALAVHGLRYELSAASVVHFFNVSYDGNVDLTEAKRADCRRQLAEIRGGGLAARTPGPWG